MLLAQFLKIKSFALFESAVFWLQLMEIYFFNRFLCFKVNNKISGLLPVSPVSSEVPHGSVLEPVLLILFIESPCDHVEFSNYFLSADNLRVLNKWSFIAPERYCKILFVDR